MNLSKYALCTLALATLAATAGCSSSSSSSSEQPEPVKPAPATPNPNKAPVATNAALTNSADGDVFIGTTLSIAYDYSDAENDASAGPAEIVWYRLDNETATPEVIADINTASYIVTSDDIDKYIRATFKPSAATGTLTGDQVTTALSAQVSSNTPPSIQGLAIKTSCDADEVTESKVGDSLVACYDYSDADNDLEDTDNTVYSWVEVNADSTETEIGTEAALTVPFSARNKTIKLSVTPYAQSGAPSGTAQQAELNVDMEAIVFASFDKTSQIIFKYDRVTDGSAEGTSSPLRNLGNNTSLSKFSKISQTAQLGEKLYHLINNAGNLVLSQVNLDGTEGTYLQNVGLAGASQPNELYKFSDKIVFSATRSGNGREMIVMRLIDGEPEMTFIDVYFGSSSSSPSDFVYAPEIDTLFFTAIGSVNDEVIGRELYKITIPDTGEIPAPTLVKDIRESAYETNDFDGSEPKNLTWVNGRLYFSAWDGNTLNQAGRTLWASNGSEAGTIKIGLGAKTGDQYPTDFVAADNTRIFFRSGSDENATSGSLYVLVANNPTELTGLNSLHGQVSLLTEFPANDSILYKATDTSNNVSVLWELKPNGNSYNPVKLNSIVDPLEKPLIKGNEIFYALKNSEGNYHIAKSVVTDLNSPTSFVRSNNDMPRELTLLNNRVIFVANGEVNNSRGIYYLDESSNVPQLLFNSNNGSSDEQYQPKIALPKAL